MEGYSTIFSEVDAQLEGRYPSLVIVPVGIGGLAQAAVTHYKAPRLVSKGIRVLGVEPESAAALQASLRNGKVAKVEVREDTILKHLNYGNVAEQAWEVLTDGLDLSTTVGDDNVGQGMDEMHEAGLKIGPCGGAVLAGLKGVLADNTVNLDLDREAIVVMIGTEVIE